MSLLYTVSLVQWVNPLLPVLGGSSSHPGDAHTLTIEPGSPVNPRSATATYTSPIKLYFFEGMNSLVKIIVTA